MTSPERARIPHDQRTQGVIIPFPGRPVELQRRPRRTNAEIKQAAREAAEIAQVQRLATLNPDSELNMRIIYGSRFEEIMNGTPTYTEKLHARHNEALLGKGVDSFSR